MLLGENHFFKSLTTPILTMGIPTSWGWVCVGVLLFLMIWVHLLLGITLFIAMYVYGLKMTKEDPRWFDILIIRFGKLRKIFRGGRYNA
jgi:type IV secretory pathway VirB3-like protein